MKKSGSPSSPGNHGASSRFHSSIDDTNPLDRVKAALAAVPGGGYEELETQSTYRQLLAVIGVSANAIAWSGLEFTLADKRLGPDPAAFHAAYKLARHRSATRDEAFAKEDGFAPFNYDALCQHLSSATARITGPKWGPFLVGLAAYLPETVVDTALRTKLKEELFLPDGGREKFNPKSDLLVWTCITKEASKKICDSAVLNSYFSRWTKALKRLYDRLVTCWLDYQETEAPRDNNVVLLLSQWASLRFRRIPISRAFSEERRLAAKIGAIGEDGPNQDCAVNLDFKVRRKNLALIVRSCKAVADRNGVLELARHIETQAKSDTECTTLVQEYARANGFSDFDRFFGMERFDFTRDDSLHSGSHGEKRRHPHGGRDFNDKRQKTGRDSDPSKPTEHHDSHNDKSQSDNKHKYDKSLTSDSTKTPFAASKILGGQGPQKVTLSEKLKVSSSVLQQRRQAGACLGCGSMDHKLADCPKHGASGQPSEPKPQTLPNTVSKDASAYSVCVAQSVRGKDRVLKVISTASPVDGTDEYMAIRLGIDSYSACNLITSLVVNQLQLEPRKLDKPLTLLLADNSISSIDTIVSLRLFHGGYSPVITCFVIPTLPEADVLLGFPDFPLIGIQVSVPPALGNNEGGILSDIDAQVEATLLHLTSQIDVWKRCPGAPDYSYRFRRLEPSEVKDTSNQTMTLEVEVEPLGEAGPAANVIESGGNKSIPFDYSIGLYKALSERARADYCSEIQNFVDHHWWVPYDSTSDNHVLVSDTDIITFPSCQKETKSTRVRACSDARQLNAELAPASYVGWSIDQILRFVRARWEPASSSIYVLDLRKAFYKIRIAHGKHVRVRTLGRVFLSDRIIFGLRIGPSILSAQVCELCSAVLTGLLGRPVDVVEVYGLVDIVSGLTILPYYDDILVIGPQELANRFVEIINRVAPVIGAEFPIDKQTCLQPGMSVEHLGVTLTMSPTKDLIMTCKPPTVRVDIGTGLSKRSVFSLAGSFYDPTYCHAEARLIADYLRAWAGRAKYGWDKKFPLNEPQLNVVDSLVRRASSVFEGCSHVTIPNNHHFLIGYTDASDIGGGCCLISAMSPTSRPHDDDVVLLEEHARLFDDSQLRWHVNRKEFYWLHRTLRYLANWVNAFPMSSQQISGMIIYCDNTTATSWGSEKKPRKYDIQAVHHLQDDIADLLNKCRERIGVTVEIKHIAGHCNLEADRLSRLGATLPELPPLSGSDAKKSQGVTDSVISCVVFAGDDDCALISPTLHHIDNERMMLVEDPNVSLADIETFTVAATKTGCDTHPYEDLTGIADMSESDLLSHVREVLHDKDFVKTLKVFDVSVADLLASFEDPEGFEAGTRLRLGGAVSGPRFRIYDGLLEYRDKQVDGPWLIYLPSVRSRAWIMYRYHTNPLLGGHRGSPRVIKAAKADGYWWPTMAKDLTRWIKHCASCQLGKWYEPFNPQPLIFRRGMNRFSALQLDFMGPMNGFTAPNQPPCPGDNMYVLVMIDEGSRAVLSLLVPNTSALVVILGLLTWFQVYGVPDYVQLDGAGAHLSDELAKFAKTWGFHLSIGIARRPQTQGLVEGVVRDLKCGLQTNAASRSALPWYISILVSSIVHNQSPLMGTSLSPFNLSVGLDLEESVPHEKVHSIIRDRYNLYRELRDERAATAEIHDMMSTCPRYVFAQGDSVRLVRKINGKRVIQGPFEVDHVHPDNKYLYQLCGKSGYVSVGQLLPFKVDDFTNDFNYAVLPHQALMAQLARPTMPNGIPFLDIKPGHWVFVIRESTAEDASEPSHDLSVSLVEKALPNSLQVVGLDRHRNKSWHLPRNKRDRDAATFTVGPVDLFGMGFVCTSHRHVPKSICSWLMSQGIDVS